MARRKKAPAEEVIELVALLPWWACVLLAVVSYAWLHHVAVQPLVVTSGQGPMQAMFRGLAVAGQYILPLLCLCSAGLSFWRRRQRAQLVDNVTRSDAGDVLQGMRWREFEMLVAEGFRLQGYQVEETGGCVFHAIADTHFTGSRTAFHGDAGHRFTLIADSVSA